MNHVEKQDSYCEGVLRGGSLGGVLVGGRCQNLLSYWVCEILKKFESLHPLYPSHDMSIIILPAETKSV